MTLAFYPLGAFLAGVLLGAVFTFFAISLRLLDRAATRTTGSVLPGLVSGFRDWSDRRHATRIPISTSPMAVSPEDEVEVVDLT